MNELCCEHLSRALRNRYWITLPWYSVHCSYGYLLTDWMLRPRKKGAEVMIFLTWRTGHEASILLSTAVLLNNLPFDSTWRESLLKRHRSSTNLPSSRSSIYKVGTGIVLDAVFVNLIMTATKILLTKRHQDLTSSRWAAEVKVVSSIEVVEKLKYERRPRLLASGLGIIKAASPIAKRPEPCQVEFQRRNNSQSSAPFLELR